MMKTYILNRPLSPRMVGAGSKLLTNDKFLQMSISQEISLRQPADTNDMFLQTFGYQEISPFGRNDTTNAGRGGEGNRALRARYPSPQKQPVDGVISTKTHSEAVCCREKSIPQCHLLIMPKNFG